MPLISKSIRKSLNKGARKIPALFLSHISSAPKSSGATLLAPASRLETSGENPGWTELSHALQWLSEISETKFPQLAKVAGQLHGRYENLEADKKLQCEYVETLQELKTIVLDLISHLPMAAPISETMEGIIRRVESNILTAKSNPAWGVGQGNRGTTRLDQTTPGPKQAAYRRIGWTSALLPPDNNAFHRARDKAGQDLCRKRLQPVDAAGYDSSQSANLRRRLCTDGTYENTLQRIQKWLDDPRETRIYWISSTNGADKPNIGYNICSLLQAQGKLAASFFCSRLLPECRDVLRVIPTIAYQLSRFSHSFRYHLYQKLSDPSSDPSGDMQGLATQFQTLIKEPMLAIKDTLPCDLILVIDALDELEDDRGTQTILKSLLEVAAEIPAKFLVTSRSDQGLLQTVFLEDTHTPRIYNLDKVDGATVRDELSHTGQRAEQLDEISNSAMIARQSTRSKTTNPVASYQEQLAAVLAQAINSYNSRQRQMDELYMSILKEALEDPSLNSKDVNFTKLILWSAACIQEPLTRTSLVRFLKLGEQQATLAWELMQTLLFVPEGTGPVAAPPPSFSNFIFSQRSGEYACDKSKHHGLLARRCLELMRNHLQFNICNLESSSICDSDVRDLGTKINNVISEEIFYSCRYLGTHLKMSGPDPSLVALLQDFTRHQLLAWLEVLNLKQAAILGAPMLAGIESWLQDNDASSDMISLVHDAGKFAASLATTPARISTPHIYISALATWHPHSPMFQMYGHLIRGLVAVDGITVKYTRLYACERPKPLIRRNIGPYGEPTTIPSDSTHQLHNITVSQFAPSKPLLKLLGQNKSIKSIAVSLDNASIMSASGSLTVCGWDRTTGKGLTGPLYLRIACFGTTAFSPDRRQVATASSQYEIFVWDTNTGKLVAGPFQGHKSWVSAIAFSPDGTRLASGARDQKVLIWDICNPGAQPQSLQGHSDYALSLVFSPQGSHLISASTDHKVRVWDLREGSTTSPLLLEGHTGCVRSVDVSPTGTHIVSASDDRTIRIWDLFTGQPVSDPFNGHTDYVLCVKFSPSGLYVVSGSQDCTIRVWDVRTGQVIAGPFEGHTSRVNTVTFSIDGTQVISGSDDGTIRVWDLKAENAGTRITGAPINSNTADPNKSENWRLNPDGWVVDKDERLLIWIPPLSQRVIRPPPPDHLMIPRIDLPISCLAEGKAWEELCRRQEGRTTENEN